MSDTEVCPKCGSGKVELGTRGHYGRQMNLARCLSCGWYGERRELLLAGLGKVVDSALEIAHEVSKTYLQLIGQSVVLPLGKAMLQAGIVGVQQKQELARLLRAACLAAHKATLEEVEKIQKELQDAQRDDN